MISVRKELTMHNAVKQVLFTVLALSAFAANSIFSRLALAGGGMDATSFTVVRLMAGVAALLVILGIRYRGIRWAKGNGNLRQGGLLFVYAACFSYAYLSLGAGVGALILFGAVQITMIAATFLSGIRLQAAEWGGTIIAFAGFAYLMLPGVSAPPLAGMLLMLVSGVAWGLYTLAGRGSKEPLRDTGLNFLAAIPFVFLLVIISVGIASDGFYMSWRGSLYAILSGALASGCGYALWYAALRGLSAVQAGVLQLSVPVIAAVGGVVFIAEAVSARLLISSVLILGGIFIVIIGRQIHTHRSAKLLSSDI